MSHQNSYVEIVTPDIMISESRAIGRYLGHERGAIVKGNSSLVKETHESSPAHSDMRVYRKEMAFTTQKGNHIRI